ncbi:unnamed protein product [Bursaphelenchus xylophilus]|uniref:(pine wood nematode) hypothetical protein n=1 Tax=Bursaphelenchus xylophilus TaxID=6326 RepID=A0A1I7RUG9_BURXY|nr:unnamed protein product [Bursaphelenchus xylophilus]CAG9114119.1 unnamed protein product [Bursaphelenchus xylophilus]
MLKLHFCLFLTLIALGNSLLIPTTLPPIRPVQAGVPPVLCSKICVTPVTIVGEGGECQCKDAAGIQRPISDREVLQTRIACGSICSSQHIRYTNYPRFGETCQCLRKDPPYPL